MRRVARVHRSFSLAAVLPLPDCDPPAPRKKPGHASWSSRLPGRLLALCLLLLAGPSWGAATAFETGNTLYFEGKFAAAAAAYEQLAATNPPSAVLYYNLGNAYYKAGQLGRAIAAYLRARQLNPRDPNLRFNLKFVREQVTGSDQPFGRAWQRAVASLTLNEWTLLCASLFWIWLLLLALRELRPALRRALQTYILLSGLSTLFLAGCLFAAFQQSRAQHAVIILREAVVRQGPLERSPVAFKLRDGSEVTVKDAQQITEQGQPQQWFQIEDAGHRLGWVKQDEVMICRW